MGTGLTGEGVLGLPGAGSSASDTLGQLQQAPDEPHLPQGHSHGLLQLHAPDVLECWLPDGRPQLPDDG